ncbi:MAG: NAD(P)-dependent oxidoreductase, partial [Betaproteobacteria bacterium]|nr:NAD(P)-dependent oxidoreductase [Betaproteobacteria bacterium]
LRFFSSCALSSIGLIGAGLMGMAMAERLQACGQQVYLCDVDPARQALGRSLGMQVETAPAALALQCSRILIVVLDALQVRDVLYGGSLASPASPLPDRLLAALKHDHRIMFCSTVSPQEASFACEQVTQAGALALDTPISGGPARARRGEISMMIAGPLATSSSFAEVLDLLSTKKFYISERYGDGSRAKLVNNLLAAINLVGAAEAMALGERIGLDPNMLLHLISESSGASWMLSHRMPRALGQEAGITAQTHVLSKDVILANAMAGELGLDLPLGALAAAHMQATCDAGWREADDSAVFLWYQKRFINPLPHIPT